VYRNHVFPTLLLVFSIMSGCAWLERNAQKQAIEAQQLLHQARDARKAENVLRADQLLRDAVAANPKDADAHLELANLLSEQGRTDEALEHLNFAARLEPEDTAVWVRIASSRQSRGEFALMEEPLENALTIEPTNVEALWLGAQLEHHRSRFDSALVFCHRILMIEPNHLQAEMLMANLHIAENHPEQAAPLLREIRSRPIITPADLQKAEWSLGVAYGMERRWICLLYTSPSPRD